MAGVTSRRFLVAVSGTNFTVLDSFNQGTTTTALAAAGTQTLPLFTLEGGGVILAAKCKPTVAFTGGAVSAATVEVGFANATDVHLARFNIFAAVADTSARRKLQIGPTLKGQVALSLKGAGNNVVVGAAGDGVVAAIALAPQAGFTGAGSNQAANQTPLVPGRDFESVESALNAIVQNNAADLSADSTLFLTTDLQGSASDAAAGTAINALFRTTGANVNALTAGSMEIDLLVWDAPTLALGVG